MLPLTDDARLAERQRPPGLAVMRQRWADLLFLHWSWDPAVVQATLPPGLTVDTFNGRAWIGLVPFFMCGVRPAFFPPLPWLSNFMELNLRTYVRDEHGRPGVWFYSLDANRWLAVKTARALFYLPYQHAVMQSQRDKRNALRYSAHRRGAERSSRFDYRAHGEVREVAPGSLEFFLVERYRLFAYDAPRRRLFTGQVAHRPYQVCAAEVTEWDGELLRLAGFTPPSGGWPPPEHTCAARDVSVEIFPPKRVVRLDADSG